MREPEFTDEDVEKVVQWEREAQAALDMYDLAHPEDFLGFLAEGQEGE